MNNKLLITSVIAASISSVSFADQGFYLGATFSNLSHDLDTSVLDDGSTATNVSIDDSDTALGFNAGYNVNANFAIELGYQDFGEVSVMGFSDGSGSFWAAGPAAALAEATGTTLGVKGSYPAAENIQLFGKIGLTSWDADFILADNDGVFPSSDDGTDMYFGVGATFKTGNVGISASFTRFDVADTDIDALSLGVELSLGN